MDERMRFEDARSVLAGALAFEEFGRDFYNTLALALKDVQCNALFRYLASDEEKHIEEVKGMIERTGKETSKEADFKPEDVFFDAADTLDTEDPVAIIEYSVKLEKAAVEIYERGLEVAQDEEMRQMFETLVKWERDHLGRLNAALKEFRSDIQGL